ncbi:hypothetical protein AYI69_g5594, partial [Smittium culicis]
MKLIADQLISNDSKKLWNFIKSYTRKSFQSIADDPVYNSKKILIIEKQSKIKIWRNHFGELAKDTTGNSRSSDKWEKLIPIYIDYYPECDSTILWTDITDALADTPNNKAPGADGVPSEGVRGVRMPGITSRIPGLLFADDAVLLAESSADLQAALDTITEWSDTWEMAVNASKCGIMTISGELTTD